MNLENFYYQIVCATWPRDRYYSIQELEDVVVVNFDCVYDREGNIRGADQLLFLLHKKGHDKRFLFISEDGALISVSSARYIIENIIKTFGLTKNTCCLICRESIEIENCTVIVDESVPYWCRTLYPYIKEIPISQGPFKYKFAAWYNRGTITRLELAKHLTTHHKDHSLISYQESGMIADRNLKDYFVDQFLWAQDNTPIVYDKLFPNRIYNFDLIVGASRKAYDQYFLEVVAETDIITSNWITEKTVKNLYIGKPFLVMGGKGILAKLTTFGFKTFSPWIDESYDNIDNIYERLVAIKQEINRLNEVNIDELYQHLQPILIHNREVYEKYIING